MPASTGQVEAPARLELACSDAAADAEQDGVAAVITAAPTIAAAPRIMPTNKKISSSIESSTAKSWPLDTIVGLAESGVGVRDEVRGPLEPSPRFRRRDQERPHMASISNGIPDEIISKYMTNLICKQQSSSQSFVLAKLRSKLAKLPSTHRKGPSEHRNPYLNTKGSQNTRYSLPTGGP